MNKKICISCASLIVTKATIKRWGGLSVNSVQKLELCKVSSFIGLAKYDFSEQVIWVSVHRQPKPEWPASLHNDVGFSPLSADSNHRKLASWEWKGFISHQDFSKFKIFYITKANLH